MYLCKTKKELMQILLGGSIPAGFPADVSGYIEDRFESINYLLSTHSDLYQLLRTPQYLSVCLLKINLNNHL